MVSVDGFFCGPNGEIDWHTVDAEFNEMAIAFLDSVDTLLFGRVTYELMANYWSTDAAKTDDPDVAQRMNALKKVYFSEGEEKLHWNNSTMLSEINAGEIRKLKDEPGKDIAIFGSGKIIEQLVPLNVIDEFRFIVSPVILGKGRTIFSTLERTKLKLLGIKSFANGNVLLSYAT